MESFPSYFIKCSLRKIIKLSGKVLRNIRRYIRTLHNDWAYDRRVHLATNNPMEYYSAEYFLEECGGCQCFASGELPYKFQFAISLLPDPKNIRILDYGCGRGELTGLLTTKGLKVKGVDISTDAIDIARKKFPNGNFEAIGLGKGPAGPFDYIFLLDIVEHVEKKHVEKLLTLLTMELSVDGKICVHTNDAEQDDKPEIRRMHPEHINLYTAQQLAQTMINAGLDISLLLRRHRLEEGYSGGIWCVAQKGNRDHHRSGRKVLITYEATVGDQLCLTPAIAEYRRRHPHDYLAVKVTHPDIYINNPYVDEIIWAESQSHFDVVHHIELPIVKHYRVMTLQDASACQLGLELSDDQMRPQFFFSEEERKTWQTRFRRPLGFVVAFAPYSGWPSREWPISRWRIVADWLEKECGATLLYLGKGDRPYPWIGQNFGGQVDLREAALLLEQCDLLLSVDNGITHLAAAVGTPTIALFGPVPAQYRLSAPWIMPVQATECIGCWFESESNTPPRICPKGHHKCMTDITPGEVIVACNQVLEEIARCKKLPHADVRGKYFSDNSMFATVPQK